MTTYTANAPPPFYASPMPQYPPAPPMPQYTPAPPMPQFTRSAEISKIRDWLPWSIISLIIGWGLGGILPLVFSIICRSNKRRNDEHGARLMSTLALVFNIIITITGIAGWIGFIVWIVWYVRFINDVGINY